VDDVIMSHLNQGPKLKGFFLMLLIKEADLHEFTFPPIYNTMWSPMYIKMTYISYTSNGMYYLRKFQTRLG